MYLRTTQRRNRDGSVIRYVQLAHNRRVDRVTQAQVLLNLGREDQLDRDGLRRLVASINRYLGEPDAGLPPADAAQLAGDGLTVTGSRPVGTVHLLDGLWQALGVDVALRKVAGPRRFTTNVERVLFALVANRAIDPMSKLSAAEWASSDVAIDGLEAMDEDQAYRAMDLLVEADAQAKVQEAVFFAVADLLNLEVDLLFFDTTSTYFERDTEEAGEDAFRLYGHSKDHRPDLPQIVIGLAVTKEGIPVRVWCWPGSTNDQTILPEVKDGIRGWRLGRIITVVDRGFSSADNLACLRRGGGHFIAGMRMRDGNPLVEQVLSRRRPARTHSARLRPRTLRPSARCAITPLSAGGFASRPAGAWPSTGPRSRPRSGWTASTSSQPPTRTSAPKTPPWATRTCWKPSVASATSSRPCCCGQSFTGSSTASAPTCCCAGWRCCSPASPNAAPA